MSDFTTSHYDLEETRGAQKLVLDTFKNTARIIENDVIPASREDPVIAGIENPASNLKKNGSHYTTIPLYPVSGDVNFLYNNFLHASLKITATIKCYNNSDGADAHLAALDKAQSFALHLPTTAALFKRLQILCGNSTVWQNQYQRQEAMVGMASLPESIISNNAEYFTPSKAINHSPIPGVYITFGTSSTVTGVYTAEVLFDFTIDLNHLTPLLSNIPFTTKHTGDLRLRVYLDDLENAIMLTPLIDSNTTLLNSPSIHVISPQPIGKLFSIYSPTTQAIASASNTIAAGTQGANRWLKLASIDWEAVGTGIEITQNTFSLKNESMEEIARYIGTDNKLVIPTQTFATALSTLPPNQNNGQLVFQLSAYNIYLLAFLFPYSSNWETYYPTPPLTNIDILLNSKSITYTPYERINSRVMKDTIQAFLNDDKYSANENLVYSLDMPGAVGGGYDATTYAAQFSYKDDAIQLCPNCFTIAKGLSPPSCFEKGYCFASANAQQAQIRLKYSIDTSITSATYNNTLNANMALSGTDSGAFAVALQDCCLVLNYNPSVGTCQSGSVIYAEPSVM